MRRIRHHRPHPFPFLHVDDVDRLADEGGDMVDGRLEQVTNQQIQRREWLLTVDSFFGDLIQQIEIPIRISKAF